MTTVTAIVCISIHVVIVCSSASQSRGTPCMGKCWWCKRGGKRVMTQWEYGRITSWMRHYVVKTDVTNGARTVVMKLGRSMDTSRNKQGYIASYVHKHRVTHDDDDDDEDSRIKSKPRGRRLTGQIRQQKVLQLHHYHHQQSPSPHHFIIISEREQIIAITAQLHHHHHSISSPYCIIKHRRRSGCTCGRRIVQSCL